MKEENYPWLQNIKYLLHKIGLRDIWLSSGMGERNYIKSIVTERLQDLYFQQFNEYSDGNQVTSPGTKSRLAEQTTHSGLPNCSSRLSCHKGIDP